MGPRVDSGPVEPTDRTVVLPAPPRALALGLAAYAFLVHRFWFLTDDAFVSFRYARNLARGAGLRWNPGEAPVEGFSNLLWTLLCAALEAVDAPVLRVVPLVSAACGAVLLWRVSSVMKDGLGLRPASVFWGTISLATFAPFGLWATSGLETMAFALLVFLVFEATVIRPDARAAALAAIALSLVRIEGAFWVLVLATCAFASGRRSRRAAIFAAAAAVGTLVVLSALRLAWSGEVVPNVVRAKASLDGPRLVRGLRYVAHFFLVFPTPLWLIPGTVVALRTRRIAPACLAWAFAAYGVVATGDFMAMGRLLVPGLAFGAVLLAIWLDVVRPRWVAPIGIVAVVLGLLPAWDHHVVPISVLERVHFRSGDRYVSERTRWEGLKGNARRGITVGKVLRAYASRRRLEPKTVVFYALGAPGYFSGLPGWDRFGLVTPEVARRTLAPGEHLGGPGHDKEVPPEFLLPRRPAILEWRLVTAADGTAVDAKVGELAASIEARRLADRYVVDFLRVRRGTTRGEPLWIVPATRIDALPGRPTPERAWAELAERRRALVAR